MTSKLRRLLVSFAAVASLGAVAATSGIVRESQAQLPAKSPSTPAVKNVVLVHGAFADGSGWRPLYNQLTAKGYRVSVVQNPLTSFKAATSCS